VIQLEQTLHGYCQGHRLLAHSGTLRADELDQLVRLSDLAGYLPAGMSFERYVTGFPCGRFYAFASTWPDFDAPRSGAVLTHTLLVPSSQASNLADLFALHELHQLPSLNRSTYEETLEWAPPDGVTSGSPVTDSTKDVVALLLFGQDQRPVIWIDHGDLTPPVRWAWQLLWPKRRLAWSFCTLALQPRTIAGKPFAWLAAPPEARAGLHRLAGSKAWWENGGLKDRVLQKRANEEWLVGLRDPSKSHAIVQHMEDVGVHELETHHLPLASRFLELAQPAAERLTAARTRADLLAQLAPAFEDAPSAWLEALSSLLAHQVSAPLEPRPLWELEDLLSRRPLQSSVSEHEGAGLTEQLATVVGQELERRIVAHPDSSVVTLPSLYRRAEACHVSLPALEAIHRAFLRLADTRDRLDVVALARYVALEARAPGELTGEVIRSLSNTDQIKLLSDLFDSNQDEELEAVSSRLSDANVVLKFSMRRGKDILASLNDAARAHIAHAGDDVGWRRVFVDISAEDAWNWSMETNIASSEMLLTTWLWCGQHGDARSLAQLARGKRRGGEAMNTASPLLSPHTVRETFRDYPELAVASAIANLISPNPEANGVARLAVEAAPAHLLLDQEFRAAIEARGDSIAVEKLSKELLPDLLRQVVSSSSNLPLVRRDWFSVPIIRRTLGRLSIQEIEKILNLRRTPPEMLGAGFMSILEVIEQLHPKTFTEVGWSAPLLCTFLRRIDARTLGRAPDRLLAILSLPLDDGRSSADGVTRTGAASSLLFLMGEILGAARRTHCTECGALVAASFPPVHSRLENDQPGVLRNCGWWYDMWWDRAKSWRRWLLHTAVAGDWPGSVLRAAAGNDRGLLVHLREIAHDQRRSWAYWGREMRDAN